MTDEERNILDVIGNHDGIRIDDILYESDIFIVDFFSAITKLEDDGKVEVSFNGPWQYYRISQEQL